MEFGFMREKKIKLKNLQLFQNLKEIVVFMKEPTKNYGFLWFFFH
jgi:hypothetical protein